MLDVSMEESSNHEEISRPSLEESISPVRSPEDTDKRLRLFAWGNERLVGHKPKVDGWENYNEVASHPKSNFVIAVSHLNDASVQAAADTFASLRKIGLVTHRANVQNNEGEWTMPAKLLGTKNFLVHGVNRDPQQSTDARANDRYHLDPLELREMARRMRDEGVTPIIAAHRPAYHNPLSESPGLSDVIIAHLSGTGTVLPVAVELSGDQSVGNSHEMGRVVKNLITGKRPEVFVHIAKAIKLPEIPLNDMALAMAVLSSDSRNKLTSDQRGIGIHTLRVLESQAGLVMDALADRLPESARGKWGSKVESGNA